MEKLKGYSDPAKVKKLGKDLGYDIKPSTRKDKKYMVEVGDKTIHFGQLPYEDWTKHKDPERRKRFLTRNKKWKDAPKDSPAWFSYHILW
mgnify:CR=1 FL=1